nr:MAG TPA: hypothetical protein [Bacteriophage sp.]
MPLMVKSQPPFSKLIDVCLLPDKVIVLIDR